MRIVRDGCKLPLSWRFRAFSFMLREGILSAGYYTLDS